MALSLNFYDAAYSDNTCGVCQEIMNNREDVKNKGGVAAHEQGGELHPVHRTCMQLWLEHNTNTNCIHCNQKVNPDSLIPWQQKFKKEFKCIIKDTVNGTANIALLLLAIKITTDTDMLITFSTYALYSCLALKIFEKKAILASGVGAIGASTALIGVCYSYPGVTLTSKIVFTIFGGLTGAVANGINNRHFDNLWVRKILNLGYAE